MDAVNKKLYRLPMDSFQYENYEEFNLFSESRPFAIGYIEADKIRENPQRHHSDILLSLYAVMFEDKNGKYWFHVEKDFLRRFFDLED